MADSEIKKGDDVYFLLEKMCGGYNPVEWGQDVEGKVVCRGQVVAILFVGKSIIHYEVEAAEPHEFYGRTGRFPARFLSKNPPGDKPEAPKSVSVSSGPQPTNKERMIKFFGKPSQSELGPKCPIHPHTSMKPLGTSFFCPECDKDKDRKKIPWGKDRSTYE